MSLINELRAKSMLAEETKNDVVAEIKNAFDEYLSSDKFENYLRNKAGTEEIKNRKLYVNVEFWEYHSGCSPTHFSCGGYTWYNPENQDGWESHKYKGIELVSIQKEICEYLAQRTKSRMNEFGFYLVSTDDVSGRLEYYHKIFYFGW